MGEKGYGTFASNKTFRYSLENSGYGVREISLEHPVAEDINIIVLADMRSDFTEEEFRNFDAYLERGGNLFILGEPKRQQFMNPVIERLGLRFADGIIVSPSEVNLDDLVAANIKEGAAKVSMFGMMIGAVTPPMGACVFIVCSISETRFDLVCKKLWPFLISLVVALLLVAYVEPISTLLPHLLTKG